MNTLEIGNRVVLRAGGYGGLNPVMLREEGYTGQYLTIIGKTRRDCIVKLPSGYKLKIDKRDCKNK